MRELEFLPAWYHNVRRRKRVLGIQCWALATLVIALGAWTIVSQRSVNAAERSLDSIRGELAQSQTEEQLLAEQLRLRKDMQVREQVIMSLGYPVEMTRLLQTVDRVMPKEVSLTEFKCDTEEKPQQVDQSAAVRGGSPSKETRVDRRLKVRVVGLAPTKVDTARFLDGLIRTQLFEDVALKYTSEKIEADHTFSQFEMTFYMSLKVPPRT